MASEIWEDSEATFYFLQPNIYASSHSSMDRA